MKDLPEHLALLDAIGGALVLDKAPKFENSYLWIESGEAIEVKKFIGVAFAITALIVPVSTPANAAWQMNQVVSGMSSFVFQDMEFGLNNSQIFGRDNVSGKQLYCLAVDDPHCASLKALMLNLVVPPCTASSKPSDMCIKNVEFGDSSGSLKQVTLVSGKMNLESYTASKYRFATTLITALEHLNQELHMYSPSMQP